ncbi:MAG: hypothetical protein JWN71_3214 [Xanthobacteraceae bacterium]|nr:hypothetical protein [Xanthobacteraceae bacterium]
MLRYSRLSGIPSRPGENVYLLVVAAAMSAINYPAILFAAGSLGPRARENVQGHMSGIEVGWLGDGQEDHSPNVQNIFKAQ